MTLTLKRIFSDKTLLVTLFMSLLALIFGTVKPSDIDMKTILTLLSLIIVISIYEHLTILNHVANLIIEKCNTTRGIILVIFLFSFFGSMFFTNDVAILTLVPIVFNISKKIKIPKIAVISLMTIYANLGSSITPFGNPQNIYLVSFFHLSIVDFLSLSLPIGLVSFLTLLLCLFFFPNDKISQLKSRELAVPRKHLLALLLTTLIVLLGVLSFIPIIISLIASLLCTAYVDRTIYETVDYGIILTFINFFIIVGAVGRIPAIHLFLEHVTTTTFSIFSTAIISSQLISNVPAAVLLSKFTNHVSAIYLGVTVGGLGTIVASLANLLALRQYHLLSDDQSTKAFFAKFTVYNIVYLFVFFIAGLLLLH